ncbi:MAG: hypothetical protein ACOY82_14760 [Pseudomonadota bacterium]
MTEKNIPSNEDFARAKAAMKKRDQGLSEVRSQVLNQFEARGVHELFVFFSPASNCFGAYVFYDLNAQIDEAKRSGLSEEIETAVLDALERVGRGRRSDLSVNFEFDSHENVEKNYGGDYYDRLR